MSKHHLRPRDATRDRDARAEHPAPESRIDHPGACVFCDVSGGSATLVKGTDLFSARGGHEILIVDPSVANGLAKPTAFAIAPRLFKLRRVALLHFDRRLGALETEHLTYLQEQLLRLFPEEPEA